MPSRLPIHTHHPTYTPPILQEGTEGGHKEDKVGTNNVQVDEAVEVGDKEDVRAETRHLDAHPRNAIPQATKDSTPGKAGSSMQSTQSRGTTTGTCATVAGGTSRCGTPAGHAPMSAADRGMWKRVIGAMQMT